MKGKAFQAGMAAFLEIDAALQRISGDRNVCVIGGMALGWCPFHTKDTTKTVFAEVRVVRNAET